MFFLIADDAVTPNLTNLLTLIPSVGVTGVLLVVIWLWLKGHIITKRELDDAKRECEEWKHERDKWEAIAMRSLNSTERGVGIAERATQVAKEVVQTTTTRNP
jgi:hypothetical protein